MSRYIDRLLYLLAAVSTSTIANLIYSVENAFALSPTTSICRSTSTVYDRNYCQPGSYWYPTWGSKCGTEITSSIHCKQYGKGGWSCSGRIIDAHSAYCICSSTAYSSYAPVQQAQQCGTRWVCGSENTPSFSVVSVKCNTGPGNAGYKSLAGGIIATWICACCPGANVPWGQGSGNVYANYDAEAASECYIMGQLMDPSGLYEYTDDNKCYYAS